MSEIIKDFAKPEFKDPIMDMWEFFNDNTHYRLIRYEPIKNGIRTFYIIVN